MSPHPQIPTAPQPDPDPGWGAVVDRVQAALLAGGCATAHFRTNAEFERALAPVRLQTNATELWASEPVRWTR